MARRYRMVNRKRAPSKAQVAARKRTRTHGALAVLRAGGPIPRHLPNSRRLAVACTRLKAALRDEQLQAGGPQELSGSEALLIASVSTRYAMTFLIEQHVLSQADGPVAGGEPLSCMQFWSATKHGMDRALMSLKALREERRRHPLQPKSLRDALQMEAEEDDA